MVRLLGIYLHTSLVGMGHYWPLCCGYYWGHNSGDMVEKAGQSMTERGGLMLTTIKV